MTRPISSAVSSPLAWRSRADLRLVRGVARLAASELAAGLGGGQALVGALDDQLALELVDRGEDVEHQPPGRRGRVDVLLEHHQADAALAEVVGQRRSCA